ncbi:monovalent cation/H+ antiporter subunit E [Corynebacterium sp. ES2794-CONJ1]|uniref:monovalent cation/H+ antiporter subunit E n=1 Tax=unclassified Corynebacterium TaxID=2624378 RepID=UPI002169AFC6|nr:MULTISPECIES: monovalent cation/H+ antiporter subunit E [unclassified Corynebacterium]MCS4490339.1 monovalent cation/H+ antiporter subunit E [Corynebacterium sp. ES2775-CONJ]MCS4492117.1 monovalent cation/H+ antiporter subunit E [Corynebacterium sp. ES2715-CONJ3]MCS4532399.1 monovalent cation/H+ antiporter subunit E [Corynebacterium sp. ES2730-CONJ]MCU9519638.1 monovalent cation/H+ antiporter subunit E [Corynebacterium sp. ES2794-CONJ1]
MNAFIYIPWLLWQLVLATSVVIWDTLTGSKKVDPCVVYYPLRVTKDWEITAFACSITITPATMSITLIDEDPDQVTGPRHLMVHAVYGSDPRAVLRDLAHMEEKLSPKVKNLPLDLESAEVEYPAPVPVKQV